MPLIQYFLPTDIKHIVNVRFSFAQIQVAYENNNSGGTTVQSITHQKNIDRLISCPITSLIRARFNQLSEDTDVPPLLVLAGANDDITASSLSTS